VVKSEGSGLFDHGDDRERVDRNPEIDQMVYQLQQFKDRLDSDDREKLEKSINTLRNEPTSSKTSSGQRPA
jgi:hypothetical protein